MHKHGQWSKSRTSIIQTWSNLARRNNHMNEFKKFSSKCTSQAPGANTVIAKLLRPKGDERDCNGKLGDTSKG
jgi:hypothetical protein